MTHQFYNKYSRGMKGVSFLIVLLLVGLLAPLLAPHNPLDTNLTQRLHPPNSTYPFGTDHVGRCILSRILYGMRISVGGAFLIMISTLLISLPIGLLAGYKSRKGTFFLRIMDGFLAVPDIVLTIAIVGVLGQGFINMMIAVVIVRWANYVRIVRSFVLNICEEDYIKGARMAGNTHFQVMVRYIIPSIFTPLAVFISLDMGKIVLLMAGLSFLGLGVQPPTPEWGVMLHNGASYFQSAPHVMLFPGLFVLLFVLACQLISEDLKKNSGEL
ncbi:ABC transporter permease subunit [Priestia filamentosa]|uniref:ABC transporter permease n=1 Tax=Priestia filamentosa TaxID=1402861 RepID=UPI00397ADCAA